MERVEQCRVARSHIGRFGSRQHDDSIHRSGQPGDRLKDRRNFGWRADLHCESDWLVLVHDQPRIDDGPRDSVDRQYRRPGKRKYMRVDRKQQHRLDHVDWKRVRNR